MTKLEIYNRLSVIDAEIKKADANREGDVAAGLEVEKGELTAALFEMEFEEEIQ